MIWQQWFNIDPAHPGRSLVLALWPNVLATILCASAAYVVVFKKMLMCQEKWCFRFGHHKVERTHYKTCPKHTTPIIHARLQSEHFDKYPTQHRFLGGQNG